MTKGIDSVKKAINTIAREVGKMATGKRRQSADFSEGQALKECIECGARLTHPGAYFCEDCAAEFYNEKEDDGNGGE